MRVAEKYFALWMIGNGVLAAWVQRCLHSLRLAAAASAPGNFQLYCCPDHCCQPWGKGCSHIRLLCITGNLLCLSREEELYFFLFAKSVGWAVCRGASVNHLCLCPSFLPLVRAGEGILCVTAACLWSGSCLLTAGSVLGILCATAC